MVQVDTTMGYQNNRVVYLPYAVGLLMASAWTSEAVRDAFAFRGFIYCRDEVEKIVADMDDPDFVGFSCYCWNTEFNKALARRIRELYPTCIIMFGGHNIPSDGSFLEKYDYIDYVIHGEGEVPFRQLLEGIARGDISDVTNISYRAPDGSVVTAPDRFYPALDTPSPYLEGWFDDVINNNPGFTFNAILETSRGCPNHCAYCDWGLMDAKPRFFPLERILDEIRWFSEHSIAFIWGADANFGINARDLTIVDALIDAKKKTGYPERMRINYSKNNFDRVFSIVKKLKDADFDRLGATLSFQTMSPVALENIGRKNMTPETFHRWVKKYNEEGMKVYSEFILGLPGETYRSFIHGIERLFEMDQHQMYEVYYCNVLPNSPMGRKEYQERFGIKTVQFEMFRPHSEKNAADIPEYCQVIIETNTMSTAEWIRAMSFSEIVRALHSYGFLRVFALYLYHDRHVGYSSFYDSLLDYFDEHPQLFSSGVFHKIVRHFTKSAEGHDDEDMTFPPSGMGVWQDCEYATLEFLANYDLFYEDVTPYLRSFGIDHDIFEDLLSYQKLILRRPGRHYGQIRLRYDIYSYIRKASVSEYEALRAAPNVLTVRDEATYDDWPEFSRQIVWYGRLGWRSHAEDVEVQYE